MRVSPFGVPRTALFWTDMPEVFPGICSSRLGVTNVRLGPVNLFVFVDEEQSDQKTQLEFSQFNKSWIKLVEKSLGLKERKDRVTK